MQLLAHPAFVILIRKNEAILYKTFWVKIMMKNSNTKCFIQRLLELAVVANAAYAADVANARKRCSPSVGGPLGTSKRRLPMSDSDSSDDG